MRTLWKILLYLQIPLYILVLKFLLTFFVKIDGLSEQVDSAFNILLYIYVFCFIVSGIVSLIIIFRLHVKQNTTAYMIAAILAALIGFTYLFTYSGHYMFIIVPAIVVIYHGIIFSAYGKIFEKN